MSGAGQGVRLGMITPSSNTALEPACAAMLAGMPGVTIHFARVRVVQISLDEAATAQFDQAPMLEAAGMLADARVNAICWNGTSASWLGLQRDRSLCAEIVTQTGIPATSASLATVELLRLARATRFGLVTPYTADVQAKIIANYTALGLDCVAERHAGITENFAFAGLEPAALAGMIREVASDGPQAISLLCTNLRGSGLAAALEPELGVRILDSTACALWGAMRLAGLNTARVQGWGSLFAL